MKTSTLLIIIWIVIICIAGAIIYFVKNSQDSGISSIEDVNDGNLDDNPVQIEAKDETMNDACKSIGCSEGMLFAGSKSSDKYYECKCRWAKNIAPENLVCFVSEDEAVGVGRIKSEC